MEEIALTSGNDLDRPVVFLIVDRPPCRLKSASFSVLPDYTKGFGI